MDLLEMRPACTMSGSDLLSALDALHAEAALRETYRLQLLARIDEIGHAKDLGARDTTELLALRHRLNPTDLRTLGRKVVDTLDTDGPEPAEDQAYQREALWLRPADHGIKFGGFLAAENAELLKTAIHALARPHKTVDGDLDPRPRDKRQADALVTIVEAATTTRSTGTGPGVSHLTVTIDYTDLKTATAGAVGELVHGDNLSAAAVRRLACDAARAVRAGEDSPATCATTSRRRPALLAHHTSHREPRSVG